MTRKTKKKVITWIIVIIVLSNNYPLRAFIRMAERDAGMYSYSNMDDPKTIFFEYGKDPAELVYFHLRKDSAYIKEHPSILKDKLYRHFRINPLKFWHWWDYFFDERYSLSYISYEDVAKNWEKKHGRKYLEGEK